MATNMALHLHWDKASWYQSLLACQTTSQDYRDHWNTFFLRGIKLDGKIWQFWWISCKWCICLGWCNVMKPELGYQFWESRFGTIFVAIIYGLSHHPCWRAKIFWESRGLIFYFPTWKHHEMLLSAPKPSNLLFQLNGVSMGFPKKLPYHKQGCFVPANYIMVP